METYLLISGATGGLGSALVVECAKRGYNLYLTDISQEGARFARSIAETYRIDVRYRACDLTSSQARQALFDQLRSEGCNFWGLINVAGFDNEGAFLEQTRQQILSIIQVDVEFDRGYDPRHPGTARSRPALYVDQRVQPGGFLSHAIQSHLFGQ